MHIYAGAIVLRKKLFSLSLSSFFCVLSGAFATPFFLMNGEEDALMMMTYFPPLSHSHSRK
jgi:hypothetical protein